MLFFVLLSLRFHQSGRFDASALSLSAAIATKSVPRAAASVLDPVARRRARRPLRRFSPSVPVALILVPYAIADFGALARELLGYGGVADFGWIGVWRGLRWLATGALARSEAAHWPRSIAAAKVLFLAVYVAMLWAAATRRAALVGRCRPRLAVFLAFLAFYGAISAQYLLWPVPFGALLPGRVRSRPTARPPPSRSLGFYLFLAPGVLAAAGRVRSARTPRASSGPAARRRSWP